jgi:hypothetical protein
MNDVSEKQAASQMKLMLAVAMTIPAILIIVVAVFLGMEINNKNDVADVVDNQLKYLRSGDYENAYILTSSEFQRTVPFDVFRDFADEHPVLHANADSSITSNIIKNNTGTLKTTLTSKDGNSNKFVYTLIKEDEKWVILNIRLKAIESGVSSTKKLPEKNINLVTADSAINLPKKFTNHDSGYSIQYPGNWDYQQPDAATVVIGGKQGTKSFDSTVNIQTVLTKESGGKYQSIKQLLDNLKKQAQEFTKNTQFYIENSITIDERPDRPAMKGLYTELTFTNNGKKYQQLVFVFLRPDKKVFYIWTFTSPVFMFNTDYPIAKAMFSSWLLK